MTHTQLLQQLRDGNLQPLYFLYGDEPFYLDRLSEFFEKEVLNESERAFNLTIRHGRDAVKTTGPQGGTYYQTLDFQTLYTDLTRVPMMAERQVVILKEAQAFKDFNRLEGYFAKPAPSTVFVVVWKSGSFNWNTRAGKALKQNAVVFKSSKIREYQLPNWISDYLSEKGLSISPELTEMLAEHFDPDLSKVANELDKLALNLAPGAKVQAEDIETYIGLNRAYNVYELQQALAARDVGKVFRIVQWMGTQTRNLPEFVVVSSLFNFFSRLYRLFFLKGRPENEVLKALNLRSAYALRSYRQAQKHYSYPKTLHILHLLKVYDLKMKGVDYQATGKKEGELLRELVWQILH